MLLIPLGLVLIIVIALQIPATQQFLARQGTEYLSKTLNTKVSIGRLTTDFRNSIVVKDFYLEDQNQDTLIYAGRLGVDISIIDLLKNNKINISSISLQNATANISTHLPDSSTNYDFILKAFATDTAVAATPYTYDLGSVSLENVFFTMQDEIYGNNVRTRIGKLTTEIEAFDPEKALYKIGDVQLENSYATIVQSKLPPEQDESKSLEMDFSLGTVTIKNFDFKYHNEPASQRILTKIGEAELETDKIDLANARIDLSRFDIKNSNLAYFQDKYTPTDSLAVNPKETLEKLDKALEKKEGTAVNWVVNLGKLKADNVNVDFGNFNTPEQTTGMDFNHLKFTGINVDMDDLYYSQQKITANLNQLQLKEKSGFRIDNFKAGISIDSARAALTNLDLKTGESHIKDRFAITYPSLTTIASDIEKIGIDANFEESVIGPKDILYFAPYLAKDPNMRPLLASDMHIDGGIKGRMDNIKLENFRFTGLSGTAIAASGTIKGMPDIDKMYMDLKVKRLTTTSRDVNALLPAGTLPPDIQLPGLINMNGSFVGTVNNFRANTSIASSYGNIKADLKMNPGRGKGLEGYDGTIAFTNFDLGKFLKQEATFGKITGIADVTGTGLSPENMRANFNANIASLGYNGQTYRNITAKGTADRNLFTADIKSKEAGLALNIEGEFNLRGSQPAYKFTSEVAELDLQKMGFYPEPLRLKGAISVNLAGKDADNLNGIITGDNLILTGTGKPVLIDSLLVTMANSPEKVDIKISSDVVSGFLISNNSLTELPVALQQYINSYYQIPGTSTAQTIPLENTSFEFNLKKTDLLTQILVPDLTALAPTILKGDYQSQGKNLKVNAKTNELAYITYNLDTLNLDVTGDASKIDYNLTMAQAGDSSILLNNLAVKGFVQNNEVNVRASVSEDKGDVKMAIGGVLSSLPNAYRFRLTDNVVLNKETWNVPSDNFIQYGTDGSIYAKNVVIERNGQSITVNSLGDPSPITPLQISFANFDIGNALAAIERNDSLAGGTLNCQIAFQQKQNHLNFTSNLVLSNFTYMGNPIGDLSLKADHTSGNRYDLVAGLTGNGNDVRVTGYYTDQQTTNALNLNADINTLNLAALQAFTQGQLKDMTGILTGQLSITGSGKSPVIRGNTRFQNAGFNVAQLDAAFKLQDESLVFDEQGIRFPNLTLLDPAGNKATVNGYLYTSNYLDYRFNLDVDTERLQIMNSDAEDNELYYGKLFVKSNTTIRGDMSLPLVNADIKVLEGSDVTMVIPPAAAVAQEREGIVVFEDFDDSISAYMARIQEDTVRTVFQGFDVRASIEVDDKSPFTVIVDPVSGDYLTVKGNGLLNSTIDPSGKISLTGRYVATDGMYKLKFYNLASREFYIQEGSTITWFGDPVDANIDIVAIYTTKAPARELVADEISRLGQTEQNKFNQQFPFQVILNLDGELLRPDITFAIELPENERGAMGGQINDKLQALKQDPSELNKQVFSLLVLNRFMAQDPMASTGSSFSASAKSSVSQLLGEQLNKLTGDYLGGLGLEVGLSSYEDYTTGASENRTDLNVAMRKELLDERLIIRAGTDVGLEGKSPQENNQSDFAGNISVEYLLLPDGRLRVRGFQENDYDIIEGQIIKTGLALIFVRDFDHFADLIKKMETAQKKSSKQAENAKPVIQ